MKNSSSEIVEFLERVLSESKSVRENQNISLSCEEFSSMLNVSISQFIKAGIEQGIQHRLLEILKLRPRKLGVILTMTLLKFHTDYLSDWKAKGKFLYYLDEVELMLSALIFTLKK